MTLAAGTTIAARYLVEREIRKEPMAILYSARDTGDDRPIWLRIIPPGLVAEGEFVKRFRREVELLRELALPQIPKVLDYGVEGGNCYIVTEPVPGKSLEEMLQESGTLEVRRALEYVQQTAECLDEVGRKGVVHGDLRPANIIVNPNNNVRIVNFGLARSVEGNGITIPDAMTMLYYISPEQTEGVEPDVRSDIYALGVTLYEMLTGEVPYRGSSQTEIVMQHLNAQIPLPSKLCPDVPREVNEIVKRCLAKDPNDRYQTPQELVNAIRRFVVPSPLEPPIAKTAVQTMNNYNNLTPAQLRIRRGPLPGRSYTLFGEKTFIGRDLGNDFSIEDPEVSRRHACVTRKGKDYSIEDLGSTNGTFVNGIRVAGQQALHDGDIIGLGQIVLAYEETVEVSNDATLTGIPAMAPPPAQPRPAEYAQPPTTGPTTAAEETPQVRWFLLGCGCVIVFVLVLAISLTILALTGVLDLSGIVNP